MKKIFVDVMCLLYGLTIFLTPGLYPIYLIFEPNRIKPIAPLLLLLSVISMVGCYDIWYILTELHGNVVLKVVAMMIIGGFIAVHIEKHAVYRNTAPTRPTVS